MPKATAKIFQPVVEQVDEDLAPGPQPQRFEHREIAGEPDREGGNMMWNDIVKANCARANTTASQPSNIGTTCRKFRRTRSLRKRNYSFRKIASEPGATLSRPMRIVPAPCAEQACGPIPHRSIEPPSPGDLGLHGAGLVLADQHRAADLSS
jgi:hypothetical protein